VRAAPFSVAALALLSLVACGDDDGDVTDAQAARGACRALVAWTNDVTDIVNATELEMVEGIDLQPLMLAAIDEVIVRTDRLGEELAAVEMPDSDGGRAFGEDLRTGQEEAAADLAGFREEILAIPDPDPESTNYRKAQLVVELEKPRSLVKPDVQGDLGDADLEAAIAAEDSCEHVTRSQ
jgi:hypothetical protein